MARRGATPAQKRSCLLNSGRRWPALRHPARRCVALTDSEVPATQVAEWAGHSVHVLMRVYAHLAAMADSVATRMAALRGGKGKTTPGDPVISTGQRDRRRQVCDTTSVIERSGVGPTGTDEGGP